MLCKRIRDGKQRHVMSCAIISQTGFVIHNQKSFKQDPSRSADLKLSRSGKDSKLHSKPWKGNFVLPRCGSLVSDCFGFGTDKSKKKTSKCGSDTPETPLPPLTKTQSLIVHRQLSRSFLQNTDPDKYINSERRQIWEMSL